MQAIFLENDQKVKAFMAAISKPRLTKYLQESNGDERHALLLYHWNSQLSQALYLPLQSWEIVLRNKVSQFLAFKYGTSRWHTDARALKNFSANDRRRLTDTIERLTRDLAPATPTNDQIVADLSAGFWVSQFGKNYGAQYGWKNNLKYRVFTNDHTIIREIADEKCNNLLDLRNRVAHHEPIFQLPLNEWRSDLDILLNGMCDATATYMASACSFKAIWQARPSAQELLSEPVAPVSAGIVPLTPTTAPSSAEGAEKVRVKGRLGLGARG